MLEETHMKSKKAATFEIVVPGFLLLIVLLCTASTFSDAAQQSGQNASTPPQSAQKTFATQKEASEALIRALETFDVPALKEILGPGGENLVASEDPVQDKNNAAAFATKAREKNQISLDPKNSKRAILSVGNDDWPLPIPLVKKAGRWSFDTEA